MATIPKLLNVVKYKYTDEQLAQAVKESTSVMGVMRLLGIKMAGSSHAHVGRRIDKAKIDRSHFLGHAQNRGKTSPVKLDGKKVFVHNRLKGRREKTEVLVRVLIDSGVKYVCSDCKVGSEWNGKPLTIQVDHIDGDCFNNLKENLRFMCPNCHSQTPTHGRTKPVQVLELVDKPR